MAAITPLPGLNQHRNHAPAWGTTQDQPPRGESTSRRAKASSTEVHVAREAATEMHVCRHRITTVPARRHGCRHPQPGSQAPAANEFCITTINKQPAGT
ncbi:MAG TPA: hypothetical protein DCG12_03230 [Planctomycetaceae bacterium]|nr:hypothetical protein [Planctomycetaceae bacterium]